MGTELEEQNNFTGNLLSETFDLKPEQTQELIEYFSGKSNKKPSFIDKVLSKSSDKVMDLMSIMCLVQLARIPKLTEYLALVNENLYTSNNLIAMEAKDLTACSKNLSAEINAINESVRRTMDVVSAHGSEDRKKYNELLDRLINISDDKLSKIEEILNDDVTEELPL